MAANASTADLHSMGSIRLLLIARTIAKAQLGIYLNSDASRVPPYVFESKGKNGTDSVDRVGHV
jgi:hypothetical protein